MSAKISLITPSTKSHRTAEETLALGYLGAILRHDGFEVSIIDGWLEHLTTDEIIKKISSDKLPSLIGVSCYRSNLDQATEVLSALRSCCGSIPAICGGYGPTFHDELFLKSGFTVSVLGEAEQIISLLAHVLINGGDINAIPNIAYCNAGKIIRTPRTEPIANLDSIFFPDRDTVQKTMEQKNFVHVCTSRGCMAHCSFCSISSFALSGSKKLLWRHRSVINIVDELKYLCDRYGVRHFKFVDDSFIEPPRDERWLQNFGNELEKHNLSIKFRTQVRADKLSPEIVKAMKSCGWFSTSVGVENFSTTALKRMLKTASQTDNIAALEMLEQNKIYVQMGMILFDPYTTVAELKENLIYLKKYTWPINKGIFTEMYAAEGTMFTKKLGQRGMLSFGTKTQNYSYLVQDLQARRVYKMLKVWHLSHSKIYDWAIDALSAPKVLPDIGYIEIHKLCQKLQVLDLCFFEMTLCRISETLSASLFEVALEAIKICREYNIDRTIVMCGMRWNLTEKHMDALIEVARANETLIRINFMKPTEKKHIDIVPDAESFYCATQRLLASCKVIEMGEPLGSVVSGESSRGCPCGTKSFRIHSITPNGTVPVSPCVYAHDYKVGDLLKDDLVDIIDSPQFKTFRKRRFTPESIDECRGCQYLEQCRGGCATRAYLWSKFNDKNKPMESVRDPYCFRDFKGDTTSVPLVWTRQDAVLVHRDYLCTLIVDPSR